MLTFHSHHTHRGKSVSFLADRVLYAQDGEAINGIGFSGTADEEMVLPHATLRGTGGFCQFGGNSKLNNPIGPLTRTVRTQDRRPTCLYTCLCTRVPYTCLHRQPQDQWYPEFDGYHHAVRTPRTTYSSHESLSPAKLPEDEPLPPRSCRYTCLSTFPCTCLSPNIYPHANENVYTRVYTHAFAHAYTRAMSIALALQMSTRMSMDVYVHSAKKQALGTAVVRCRPMF